MVVKNLIRMMSIGVLALGGLFLAVPPAQACTELWAAAMGGSTDSIRRFHQRGDDINCKDDLSGETPLMAAVVSGNPDVVELLLSLGADPNATNPNGRTALWLAQDSLKVFSDMPASSPPVQNRKRMVAMLEPVTNNTSYNASESTSRRVETSPDMIADMKLNGAYALLSSGDSTALIAEMESILSMSGVSDAHQVSALSYIRDASMQIQDLARAKDACERMRDIRGADRTEVAYCTDTLRTIRSYRPELFR